VLVAQAPKGSEPLRTKVEVASRSRLSVFGTVLGIVGMVIGMVGAALEGASTFLHVQHSHEFARKALAGMSDTQRAAFGAWLRAVARNTHSRPVHVMTYSQLYALEVAMGIAILLLGGHLVFAIMRLAAIRRRAQGPNRVGSFLTPSATHVTIVTPAFHEDPRVLRRTLLAAAVQTHVDRDIVVLLDDAPTDRSRRAIHEMVGEIDEWFAGVRATAASAPLHTAARDTSPDGRVSEGAAQKTLRFIADAFDSLAAGEPAEDHEAAAFAAIVLRDAARELRAWALDVDAGRYQFTVETAWLLAAWLSPRIQVFERKRYANSPHAPTKATNINAFLQLRPGAWREEFRFGERVLKPAEHNDTATFVVEDAPFIMSVDADSFVVPRYLTQMLAILEQPKHAHTAVAQTPYRSIPNAPTELERIAAATTDMQYVVHQGYGQFEAAFWVGANAVLRRSALEAISSEYLERRRRFRRYVADRTLIEDSEATICLAERGFRIFNHPEPLAYSATPPDLGALIIQRRRWANGGLLIMPGLLRYLVRTHRFVEVGLRAHYLLSTAFTAFFVPFLAVWFAFAYPFVNDVRSPWLALGSVAGVSIYAHELKRNGYRRSDALRVYALNLVLLPVIIGGTLRSIQQLVTGRRAPFGRTPKVQHRTRIPGVYAAAMLAMIALLSAGAVLRLRAGNPVYASFLGLNLVAISWGVFRLVGIQALLGDLWHEIERPADRLLRSLRRVNRDARSTASVQGPNDEAVGILRALEPLAAARRESKQYASCGHSTNPPSDVHVCVGESASANTSDPMARISRAPRVASSWRRRKIRAAGG
jgi:cellulose synthase (UDP-forming)